jgi:hypothetical protein
MRNLRILNQEQGGALIAMVAIIFGGFVRLYPARISGFPINDGGLFVTMIEAIKSNGLQLPLYIQYNNINIPFAYPPFAFYVGAILSNFFHLNPIDILQWLPGVVSVATVPAFYYLSKGILKSSYQAGLATLAFAFTPRSYTWAVMGGGLTRSFGLLFLLLSLGFIYRLFKENNKKYLFGSILFSALVVLTHPEAMVHTIAFALLFWLFVGRNKKGVINAFLIALGTIFFTGIWWLPAIINLGLNPFLEASKTGSQAALTILFPFLLTLTDEPFLTFIAVLGLIGFFVCLVNKNYLIPTWYFVPYLVEPRSAPTYAMIPLSIMAGLALSDAILPAIAKITKATKPEMHNNPLQSVWAVIFLITLGFFMLAGTLFFGTEIAGSTLSEPDRAAFNWIKESTPLGSRFLILTGESQIFCDSVQEWFPTLTKRVGITTIQGNEWLSDNKFARSVTIQSGIQSCLNGPSSLGCIEKYNLQYEYIFINTQGTLKNSCRVVAQINRGGDLINTLKENTHYQLAYQSGAVSIFSFIH